MRSVYGACLLLLCTWAGAAFGNPPQTIVQQLDEKLAQLRESDQYQTADRATFLRRSMLDLVGRIPTAAEAREFASADSTETRRQAAQRLSQSPAASRRLAAFVRTLWFPQTSVDPYEYLAADTEAWIADQLNHDRPLNEIARELISVSYAPETSDAASNNSNQLTTPKTLIEANDHRPERMAANATGSFLGVDLSCAQCHDHPFDAYSQEQFWQTAAFFLPSSRAEESLAWHELEIEIPDAAISVRPVLFTATSSSTQPLRDSQLTSGREVFADWVGQTKNPFFARWTVNQLWAEYFGQPLVTLQPDQVGDPIREEALDLLAEAFVEQRFNLRWLAEVIVSTSAYQTLDDGPSDTTSTRYPYMTIRGLTGSQLYDSLNIAGGKPPIRSDLDSAEQLHDRAAFLQLFPTDRSVDVERSATQALSLMNGDKISQLTDPRSNLLVQGLTDAPFLSQRECIESVFWSTVNRPPSQRDWEQLRAAGYLNADATNRGRQMSDLFWVLVNSVEFNTNH